VSIQEPKNPEEEPLKTCHTGSDPIAFTAFGVFVIVFSLICIFAKDEHLSTVMLFLFLVQSLQIATELVPQDKIPAFAQHVNYALTMVTPSAEAITASCDPGTGLIYPLRFALEVGLNIVFLAVSVAGPLLYGMHMNRIFKLTGTMPALTIVNKHGIEEISRGHPQFYRSRAVRSAYVPSAHSARLCLEYRTWLSK
jgi:hypothetical protein